MRWIVLLVAVVGCVPSEEDFPETWASVACNRMYECDKGQFESNYNNMEDCRNQSEDFMDAAADAADLFGGEYDKEHAGECLAAMRSASCEDVSRGDYDGNCDNIYD